MEDQFHTYVDAYDFNVRDMAQHVGLKRAKAHYRSPIDVHRALVDRAASEYGYADTRYTSCVTLALAEMLWRRHGRPYYKIYPDYFDVFRNTQLDVPIRFFRPPFPALALQFAVGREPVLGGMTVRNVLCSCAPIDNAVLTDLGIRGTAATDEVVFMYACGVRDGKSIHAWDTYTWIRDIDGDKTVEEAVAEHPRDLPADYDEKLHGSLGKTLLRVYAAVCFLATGGDKLVEPDLLNKDFESYLAAVNAVDRGTVRRLTATANNRRNGQIGHTVGRAEHLLGRRAGDREDVEIGAGEAGDGCERRYQHQRKGHFHRFWSGPNRGQLTIRWVSQLTVRPDLPLPPEAKPGDVGGRTLTSKAAEAAILTHAAPGKE